MSYIKKLFKVILEVLLVMVMQYAILFGVILIFGTDRAVIIGSIFLMVFEIGYIIYYYKRGNIYLGRESFFPYILLGTSISIIYNMVLLGIGKGNTPSDISIVLNIMASCIVGPIFEEVLFRYRVISKLEEFNSKWGIILISSFIFALMHNNLSTIVFAFIIGLCNSYFYLKKHNLLVPICIHVSANLISTFLYGYNVVVLILGILLFIISMFIIKRRTS